MPRRILVLAGRRRSLATLLLLRELWALHPQHIHLQGVACRSEWSTARIREWSRRFGNGMWRKVAGELGLTGGDADPEQQQLREQLKRIGQPECSIAEFCGERGIPFRMVRDLEQPASLAAVRAFDATQAVYSGAGILRKGLLDCFPDGVLNLHCGPLPAVRGMNGVEWSLFLGLPPMVTLHYIDCGIDTGPILAERRIPLLRSDTLAHVRGRSIITGIELLRDVLPKLHDVSPRANPSASGRQYFQMTDSLKAIASERLHVLVAG